MPPSVIIVSMGTFIIWERMKDQPAPVLVLKPELYKARVTTRRRPAGEALKETSVPGLLRRSAAFLVEK